MFKAVEDVETLQLCVHTWPHPRTEEVSKRHYSPKAKGFVVRDFFSDNDTVYILGCGGAIDIHEEQALKVTRGGCLITDRLFGVILAPYARARVGHMPGDI